MNGRLNLTRHVGALSLGFFATLGALVFGEEELPEPRKLLFFDLWKLDAWNQIELLPGEPRWIPEATYVDPAGPTRGVHFPTVWHDEETGKWRMVHSLNWSPFTLMAAESDDGIAWHPLVVPDARPTGEKLAPHHVFTLPSGAGSGAYRDPRETDGWRWRIFARQDGDPVIERALADPNHRWHEEAKAVSAGGEKKPYLSEAVTLVSHDGLHWELKTGGAWDWGRDDWFPEPPVFAFWNEKAKRHVMTVRPGWGDRRQCLRFSENLQEWSDPELQFQPDPLDTEGPLGMYGLPVIPVGNGAGYVGLLWIFHNGSSEPVNSYNQFFGTMDAQLAYSYDGIRFVRGPREPFIRLNPMPEPGCTQVRPCSLVETETEIRIYSEAHRGEHGRERSEQKQAGDEPLGAMILHTLRKDGWMFLRSRGDWGSIQTKPFVLWSPEIRLNANAAFGEVRYQLTDEKSQPIEGFTFDDCVPLRGADEMAFPLTWQGADSSKVLRRPVRLEVRFRNANLYAFEMAHHFLDAQDARLLKDGKAIDFRLFDF
ncbi:MAG: hypothetical protein KDN19_01150 [Verrucomicrobiae bacterium]|nr:hypothetical protein [Verrucomicrobiae bacterium]